MSVFQAIIHNADMLENAYGIAESKNKDCKQNFEMKDDAKGWITTNWNDVYIIINVKNLDFLQTISLTLGLEYDELRESDTVQTLALTFSCDNIGIHLHQL